MSRRLMGKRRSNLELGWGVGHAGTAALINAMASQPPIALVRAIDDLIIGLDDDGWWDEIGYLLIPTLHTEQASLLDWKNPGQRATNSGVTWTQYQGFTGISGVGLVLPAPSQVPGWVQNGAHVGVWCEDGTTTGAVINSGSSPNFTVTPKNASNNFAGSINGALATIGASANKNGLFHVTRTDGTQISGYKSGVLVATVASNSTGVPASPNTALLLSDDDRCLFACMGGPVTADPADLYARLGTFFTAIGTTHT